MTVAKLYGATLPGDAASDAPAEASPDRRARSPQRALLAAMDNAETERGWQSADSGSRKGVSDCEGHPSFQKALLAFAPTSIAQEAGGI